MYGKKYVHLTDFVLIYHRENELADTLGRSGYQLFRRQQWMGRYNVINKEEVMPEEKIHEEELEQRGELDAESMEEEPIHREGEEEPKLEEPVHKEEEKERFRAEEPSLGEEREEEYTEDITLEEIINTEGAGTEKMAEQDYETVEESKIEPEFLAEEPKKKGFFRRNKEEAYFLRDKWILSRIRDEDLMNYLVLEQKRNEQLQKARDIREKRIVSAFKLTVSLAAGVAVVYLLKDNPTIFVNILYIGGILGGFWFWKNSREK